MRPAVSRHHPAGRKRPLPALRSTWRVNRMPDPLFDNEFLKKLEYLELIARRLVFGRQQAARASIRKGASVEFKDFREYSPGDDPRTVDWSVYARLGTLVIKLFR